jgi:hypothetical protein
VRLPPSINKTCVVVIPVIPAITGNVNRRIAVQASLGKNVRPYLKKNDSKEGWKYGLSGRASVWQDQGPEFKSSTAKKKKEK